MTFGSSAVVHLSGSCIGSIPAALQKQPTGLIPSQCISRSPKFGTARRSGVEGLIRHAVLPRCLPAVPLRHSPGRLVCFAAGKGGSPKPEDVTVVAQPSDGNKLKIRVDIAGRETQRFYNSTLMELARNTPPGPGFRKAKGGKTAIVSKEVLLHMLGEKRVRSFVVDQIVNEVLRDYVEKENLSTEKEAKTDQSPAELVAEFVPGKSFGFDANITLLPAGEPNNVGTTEAAGEGGPEKAEAVSNS